MSEIAKGAKIGDFSPLNLNNINKEQNSLLNQIKTTLKLALPIFCGQLAASAMGVVDTVMAGWASSLELAGVAIGSSIFWPAELFLVGISLAIHPLIANLMGAKDSKNVARKMHLASLIILSLSLILTLALITIPYLFPFFIDADKDMLKIGQHYLIAVGLAMPGFALFNILRAYWEGVGKSLPTLFFGLMALILNIPFNYIFIFGKFNMPELGGVGCGVASALSIYLTVIAMFIYIKTAQSFKDIRLYQRWYISSLKEKIAFIKYALPLGIAAMVETLCFSLVALLLSPFGPTVLSAHTIAMNILGLLVIVPLALSSSASIMVGHALGAQNQLKLKHAIISVIMLALGFFICAFIALILYKEHIIALYTQDIDVHNLALVLILFGCAYLLPDTLQLIASGILRGFKESRAIFYITIIAYWLVGMPLGFSLAYNYLNLGEFNLQGAQGFWVGFVVSLSLSSILLSLRIIYILRRNKVQKGKLQA